MEYRQIYNQLMINNKHVNLEGGKKERKIILKALSLSLTTMSRLRLQLVHNFNHNQWSTDKFINN